MKRLIVCFAVLTSVLAVSCKKGDEAKPSGATPAPARISVEYKITNVSGQVGVDYIAPNANGVLETQHMEVNRTTHSIKFNHNSGNAYSVSAYNLMPSHDVVQVQIFVDGELKAENSSTNPGQNAIAQGNF